MTIRTVSNASQLNAAINAANNGDTIKLNAGNYGSIKIANVNKNIDIELASGSNPAVFKAVNVVNSSNLTFDGLDFNGTVKGAWGTGTGMKIQSSRNITVENSDFQDYYKGLTATGSQGIVVSRNEFTRQSEDAMSFGTVNGLQVLGNEVKGMKTPKEAHHDMIQINPVHGPSSNVVIKNNVLDSNDLITQSIYIGGKGAAHKNITIEDNKIIGGHFHGVTVTNTSGLKILDNIVLKDGNNGSFKMIDTPTINVVGGSSNVSVKGNTTYEINGASSAGNKIVPETVKFSGSTAPSGGWSAPDPSRAPVQKPSGGSGDDDVFRFDGDTVRGWTKNPVSNFDFADGDELHFTDYDAGTFRQVTGDGNWLKIIDGGRGAVVDSAADLKELIKASSDVKGLDWGNTLALRVKQDDGTHAINISGIAASDFL